MTDATEALLPCPFCGGPARVFQKWRDPKPLNWRVCCDNEDDRGSHCLMEVMSDFDSEAEAVSAWNRRALLAGNDEVARLLEALTKVLASCRYARADKWCGTIDCPCKIAEAALEPGNG